MDLEEKFNLLLVEMKNICTKIDDKFEKVDERFKQIDKKFEQIDERFDNLEKRFDKFEEKNEAEHRTMFNMLNTLTSSFLRFEAEQTEKINYLLEADKERKEHQVIYAHEFTRLNNLVAQNSFRISNLEKHFN